MYTSYENPQQRGPISLAETSTQEERRMSQNNNSSHNNSFFNQKLLSNDEQEGKLEVPGDIKLLFENDDRLSEFDSQLNSSVGNFSNWDRSDGESTPVRIAKLGKTLKSSSFKVQNTLSKKNSFVSHNNNNNNNNNNGAQNFFSPKINPQNKSRSSLCVNNFQQGNRNGDKKISSPQLHNKKGGFESDDNVPVQKVSLNSLKISFFYNYVCPFCTQTIQQVDNPDATHAYVISGSQKIYLAHTACFQAMQYNPTMSKISVATNIGFANIMNDPFLQNSITGIENIQDNRRPYFIKMEAFHPISPARLFKIEKMCTEICTTNDDRQFLHLDLASNNTFFEPGQYLVPFDEFKLNISIYQAQTQEEVYEYEFNIDLIKLKYPAVEGKSRIIEASYGEGEGYDVTIGMDFVHGAGIEEFSQRLGNKLQYYNPNVLNSLVGFRFLAIALPMRRNVRKNSRKLSSHSQQHSQHSQQHSQQHENPIPSPSKDVHLPLFNFNATSPARLKAFHGYDGNNNEQIIMEKHEEGEKTPEVNNVLHLLQAPKIMTPGKLSRESSHSSNMKKGSTIESSPAKKLSSPNPKIKISTNAIEYSPNTTTRKDSSSSYNNTQGESSSAGLDNNASQKSGNIDEIDSFNLDEHLEKIPQLARTYRGSKILQDFILKANKPELDKIVWKLASNAIELMLDPYANYMIQILAKHCNAEQRLVLLQKIAPAMYKIACDKKGTYALQTIVSLMNTHAEDQVMKVALGQCILELALDVQANHVVQKLINAVATQNIDFIYQPLVDNFLHVATHSSGSLVFKQLIIKVEKIANFKNTIIHLVSQEMENLVQDPYGNYVIQYALEYYPKDCSMIQQKIINKLIPYSSQKFSSNIIEKSLAVGDFFFRKKIAIEILKNERLADLLKNKYGNYVILHTLAICDMEEKQNIMKGIHRCVYSFQGTKYKQRWIKFLDDNPLKIQWDASSSPSNKSPTGKGSSPQFDNFDDYVNDPRYENHEINKEEELKKLEIVKKVWRDMNKEEKKEPTPRSGKLHNNNHNNNNNNHHYNKGFGGSYEEYSDGSPNHMHNGDHNMQNGYQEPYNFYLTPNKMEQQQNQKWY